VLIYDDDFCSFPFLAFDATMAQLDQVKLIFRKPSFVHAEKSPRVESKGLGLNPNRLRALGFIDLGLPKLGYCV